MKKLVLGILIAIPVILGAAFLYVYFNLNSLVVEAVETFAPRVTGTRVSLASSNISVFSGEGSLDGLLIGNPKGYKAPSAMELDSLEVAVDTESLTTGTIVIKSIDVVAPAISYEPGGAAGSNLQRILKNVQAGGGKSKEGTKAAEEEKPGPKVVIDRVTITQGEVKLFTPLTDEPVSADLPKIELKGIGRNKGGVSAEQALTLVLDRMLAAASKTGAGSLSEVEARLKGALNKKVEDAKGKATDALEEKAGDLGGKIEGLLR